MPCMKWWKCASSPSGRPAQPRKLKVLWLLLVSRDAVSAVDLFTMVENTARRLILSGKRVGCAIRASMCWRALSCVECWLSV